MAVFWKAGGTLLVLSLVALGWRAEGRGNGRGKQEVAGSSTFNLGQGREFWRPLTHTTVNFSQILSIKSSFEFRTFDPEGAIFYGDTKDGGDWFVLALKDGIPLMQISKLGMLVSVAGGPKLNDGKWHKLEVSNREKFVILEVDGGSRLVVGMESHHEEEVIEGSLRLALGGMLIDKKRLSVEFGPQMDGCVRGGVWLNVSTPWQTEAEDLWSCHHHIQPGSYFPGAGYAVYNTSVFSSKGDEIRIDLYGDFTQMNGTILSIKAPGEETMFTLAVNNITKEVTLAYGELRQSISSSLRRLELKFEEDSLFVHEEENELKGGDSFFPVRHPAYRKTWREGRLAIGGLLGDGEENVGSQFLTGCLTKIQIQGEDLDLDLADKHMSISSYSCPA